MVKKAEYHKMTRTDDGFVDLQYARHEPRFPWGGILLALFLLIGGTVLMTLAFFMIVGEVTGKDYFKLTDGIWPCMILGMLMFIPGVYYVRIAWLAYRGYPGYHFDDIPNFD